MNNPFLNLRRKILAVTAVAALWLTPMWADPADEILDLERQAMEGWLRGDPEPQLAIMDPQITYFHAVAEGRIEGLSALKELYERYRGVPLFDRYEILNPSVQLSGDVAVLTYVLAQHNGSATSYWKGTQVYQKTAQGWRVIHAHWSEAEGRQP
jgi:hypothetical protein